LHRYLSEIHIFSYFIIFCHWFLVPALSLWAEYISVRVGDLALLKGENKQEIKIGQQNHLLKGKSHPGFS
jgi:hypothetical protein